MKTKLLLSALSLAASTVLAVPVEPSAPTATPAPAAKPAPPVTATGRVTVTIDANGKKETHELNVGNATAFSVTGGGSSIRALEDEPGAKVKIAPAPWLGVAPDELSEDVRAQLPIDEGTGLILRSVISGSPAAQAGLQKNDVLTKLDDQILTNAKQLHALVHTKKEGDKVKLTYFRGGKSAVAEAEIKLHEGDGEDLWSASKFLSNGPGNAVWIGREPLKLQSRMVIMDKDGKVLITKENPDVEAATVQIEKALRDAGVSDEVISKTKSTIDNALKAVGDIGDKFTAPDGEVARTLRKTTEQVTRSLEQARAAADDARKQAEQTQERIREELKKRLPGSEKPTE